jgi:DivIVA domain-containing protein
MPDGRRPPILSSSSLTPDQVARRTFTLARRGYDTAEVRAFLDWVASGLQAIDARQSELRRMLEEAERRAANPELDETTLTNALGQETARILRTAHDAANEVTARAEENATRALNRAQEEAASIRERAEGLMVERRGQAEAAAEEASRAAEAQAAAIVDSARKEAETVIGRTRDEGREMVREAQELRARILGDLARRRRILHTQVEQLRAGKVSLAESVEAVRRTVDQVHQDLRHAEENARAAADVAARRVAAEPEPSSDELARALAAQAEARRAEPAPPGSGAPAAETPPAHPEAPTPPPSPPPETSGPSPAEQTRQAESAGPPEPAPEPEERRSNSLRLLRRTRPGTGAGTAPAGEAVGPGTEGDEAEGVRILGTQAELATGPAEAGTPTEERTEESQEEPARSRRVADADAEEAVHALFARIRASRPAGGSPAGEPGQGTEQQAARAAAPTLVAPVPAADEAGVAESPEPEGVHEEGAEGEVGVPSADEQLLQRRDAAIEPIVTTLSRKLKRALGDEHNDTLDRLRSRRNRSATEAIAPVSEQEDRISEVSVEFLERAVAQGAEFAGHEAKVKAKARSTTAGEEAAELARAIVGPLHARIEEGLDELAAGDDAALVEHISASYREWKGQRIERLAGDHVAAAFARGALAATPSGTKLRWIVDDEGARCPDCDDNALAGPVTKGDRYPTGQVHPPAHAGCRCLLAPSPA